MGNQQAGQLSLGREEAAVFGLVPPAPPVIVHNYIAANATPGFSDFQATHTCRTQSLHMSACSGSSAVGAPATCFIPYRYHNLITLEDEAAYMALDSSIWYAHYL
jgi:hypothetical protein